MKNKTLLKISFSLYPLLFLTQSDSALFSDKKADIKNIQEITVTGTLKEVSKSDNPVNIQIFRASFFNKNPASNILENITQVSGVRPQVNCNICGTGDIHINGMEGPYTMVLIDGMPLVSGLSTVYGLTGIPRTMIERMEVMKGPASSLYGSEAMGGIINLITKKPNLHPKLSLEFMSTSLMENTLDIGSGYGLGKKTNALTAIHAHYFNAPFDENLDMFTDLPLQKRISLFQKITLSGKKNGNFNIGGRFFWEDRWGGDVRWKPEFRGSDSIYGETIQTLRWEVIGTSKLPFNKNIFIWYSINEHIQKSTYGLNNFDAVQKSYFIQIHHDFSVPKNDFLFGLTARYLYYDDNTVATEISDYFMRINKPYRYLSPGIFVQWDYKPVKFIHALCGFRTDYHPLHGLIPSPRLAFKLNLKNHWYCRANAATGFRVVNLFTEEHAALSGARAVEIRENLNPEKSYNLTFTLTKKIYTEWGILESEAGVFYSYFYNKIIPDYSDVNKIIYDNLDGYAECIGLGFNLNLMLTNNIELDAGINIQENTFTEKAVKQQQPLSERFSAVWNFSIPFFKKINLKLDYTGYLYGPMKLPLQGPHDPRPEFSPLYHIHNIQWVKRFGEKIEFYAGIKNIFDWVPWRHTPLLIPRTQDPFDKNVQFDTNGQPLITPDNPYGLVFDPSYVYAPNTGRRYFLGIRLSLR